MGMDLFEEEKDSVVRMLSTLVGFGLIGVDEFVSVTVGVERMVVEEPEDSYSLMQMLAQSYL